MNSYIFGCDGGGTKTAVQVITPEGLAVDKKVFGALNLTGESKESVSNTIKDIAEYIQSFKGICEGICIGTAGISNKELATMLRKELKKNNIDTDKTSLIGDSEAALYGAFGTDSGIILIAGTGSICLGKNAQGKTHRSGGYGHLIDDEGSGYAIGRDILTAVVRAHDGRNPQTVFTKMVFDALSLTDIPQLISFVYNKQTRKQDIAALAPLFSHALSLGDNVAHNILEKICYELSLLVKSVVNTLQLETGNLVFLGSILNKDVAVNNLLKTKIIQEFPHIHCVEPLYDAAFGAALYAKDHLK